MKISVWNLMRPNSKTIYRNSLFVEKLNEIDSDIIILTETNTIIDFGDKYFSVSTKPLPKLFDKYIYEEGENRVTIFSKFPFIREIPTSDNYTSVCAETKTPFGQLIIYGTIIGYLGGLLEPFESDLKKQTLDLIQLSKQGNICFSGDLNIAFSGRAYPSKLVVKNISNLFDNLALINLTKDYTDSAIHRVISNSFMGNKKIEKKRIQFEKKITDHNLVTIILSDED
jgi:hypothetical protein